MIKIVNIRYCQDFDVYGGRENKRLGLSDSIWQNNFVMKSEKDRNYVIEKDLEQKRFMLRRMPEMVEELLKLDGKTMACWCSPKKCHLENLNIFLNELKEYGRIL